MVASLKYENIRTLDVKDTIVLMINGNAAIDGTLTVLQNAKVNVTGTTTVNATLDVKGEFNTGTITTDGSGTITGNGTITADELNVSSGKTMTITAGMEVTVTDAEIEGTLAVNGILNVTNVVLSGSLDVEGKITTDDIIISQNSTGTLSGSGDYDIDKVTIESGATVVISEDTTITAFIDGTDGMLILEGTLVASDGSSVYDLIARGDDAVLDGKIIVTNMTVENDSELTVDGEAEVSGLLDVNGILTISENGIVTLTNGQMWAGLNVGIGGEVNIHGELRSLLQPDQITNGGYIWTFDNGVTDLIYDVTITTDPNAEATYETLIASHGQDYVIGITAASDHSIDRIKITMNGRELVRNVDFEYNGTTLTIFGSSINGHTGPIDISVSSVENASPMDRVISTIKDGLVDYWYLWILLSLVLQHYYGT